jgi:hypothetical protein
MHVLSSKMILVVFVQRLYDLEVKLDELSSKKILYLIKPKVGIWRKLFSY